MLSLMSLSEMLQMKACAKTQFCNLSSSQDAFANFRNGFLMLWLSVKRKEFSAGSTKAGHVATEQKGLLSLLLFLL